MPNTTEDDLTAEVLTRYAGTPDPRLREVLQALIRHLHAFTREVRLTDSEWADGIAFLTRTGQISDDRRQEMILLSDNLGLSALVNLVSSGVPEAHTESTVVGPFYIPGSPQRRRGESLLLRPLGGETECVIHGRVVEVSGRPVPEAAIEVWQTDSNGMYDIQDCHQPEHNLRGCYTADDEGGYEIRTIRPTSYPIPTDGTVGELLRATGRHPWRPAHVHMIVRAAGFHPLTTHLFDADDNYLESDVVFAVKDSLVRPFVRNASEEAARRFAVTAPFWDVAADIVLARSA